MPTAAQDHEFANEIACNVNITEVVINKNALKNAISWIATNLSPEDVFPEEDLEAWAEANGYKKDGHII